MDGPLILIVDDSPETLLILSRALKGKGYRVDTATNGRDALDHVEHHPPRLILLDMSMPVMDGWEFIRAFRNLRGRQIPIAIMTAAEDSLVRANEVGADAYIGKPIDLNEVYEVVEDTALE